MKRLISLLAVVAISLAGVACDNFFSPRRHRRRSSSARKPQLVLPRRRPSPDSALCQTVVAVEISAPTVLVVRATAGIDATPLSAAGPRPEECDIASGIVWSFTGPCRVSSPNSFSPDLFATEVGICALEAQVEAGGRKA